MITNTGGVIKSFYCEELKNELNETVWLFIFRLIFFVTHFKKKKRIAKIWSIYGAEMVNLNRLKMTGVMNV